VADSSTADVNELGTFYSFTANIPQRVLHNAGFGEDAVTLLAFQQMAADDGGSGRLWVKWGGQRRHRRRALSNAIGLALVQSMAFLARGWDQLFIGEGEIRRTCSQLKERTSIQCPRASSIATIIENRQNRMTNHEDTRNPLLNAYLQRS
jgi:hypothetical protein